MNKSEDKSILIAENLSQICKARGISLTRLSKMTGISKGTLFNIVHGTSSPYLHTILRICEALDITLYDLMFESMDQQRQVEIVGENELTAEERYILKAYRQLPEKKRNWLKETLNMLFENES